LARLTARQYLTAVIAGYKKLLRDVDISRFKKDEEFTWTIGSETTQVRKVGDNRVEVGMLLAAEKLLAHLCPGCDFSDGRELYVSALIFSGMLFMTARYGDIVPNSNVTLLVMIVQIVVYILAFVLIFPFVLET